MVQLSHLLAKWCLCFLILSLDLSQETTSPLDSPLALSHYCPGNRSRQLPCPSIGCFLLSLAWWKSDSPAKSHSSDPTLLCVYNDITALYSTITTYLVLYLLPHYPGFSSGSMVKNLPAMQETQEMWAGSLGWEDPLWFKSINSSVLSFLHSPTLASVHDSWKNNSLD